MVEIVLHELRTGFGLRAIGPTQEKAEAIGDWIVAAGNSPHLVSQLHSVNDRIQRDLIELGAMLGERFFGYPAPSHQSQTQTQS